MSPEQDRFNRLAVEFWKECCEALKPIEERYGMERVVSGYEYDDDVSSLGPKWTRWMSRPVYSIEDEIARGADES
jgi:phage/plasmid-associated DNA primase